MRYNSSTAEFSLVSFEKSIFAELMNSIKYNLDWIYSKEYENIPTSNDSNDIIIFKKIAMSKYGFYEIDESISGNVKLFKKITNNNLVASLDDSLLWEKLTDRRKKAKNSWIYNFLERHRPDRVMIFTLYGYPNDYSKRYTVISKYRSVKFSYFSEFEIMLR